jgi:hypothetical protein
MKRLDTVFSIFRRMRAETGNGTVFCYTCGRAGTVKTMQAGHYISRRHMSTRWDEINVQAQCVACNIFNQGNGPAFARALVRQYGDQILDVLEMKKNNTCKMGRFEYEILIKEYERRVSEMGLRQ